MLTKAPLLYAPSAAVNVPGGLAASPLATPAPGRLCPLGQRSTLRRFSAGFPHPHASQSPECGTGVVSPLKPANRERMSS